MVKLNHHYQKLTGTYLFSQIEKRIEALKEKTPKAPLINLGIGDFTRPLPPTVVAALVAASQEMGDKKTFRGYGPSVGYEFLRKAIAENEYKGLAIGDDEVFISDGANSDVANLQEIFAQDNRVAIPDPTYPVYIDTNVMAGRTRLPLKTGRYGGVAYLPCTASNGFNPEPPSAHCDLIYLCSPNNPTGTAMDRPLLKRWVDYAKANNAVILFDGAYEAFITSPNTPRSIYEIEGAKEIAVEVRSFSKSIGFTGLRCSYTVIPHQLKVQDAGRLHSLNALWRRRVETKSNGVAYPIQKAALSIYTPSGQKEMKEIIQSYTDRARFFREGLQKLGLVVYGGIDSPYLWCKTPARHDSWSFFEELLNKAQVVAIPGRGFGALGEGYIRFSAFADQTAIAEGLLRLKAL